MSRFIDQIRKAKQARLEALQRDPDGESDADLPSDEISVSDDENILFPDDARVSPDEDLFGTDAQDETPSAPDELELDQAGLPVMMAEDDPNCEESAEYLEPTEQEATEPPRDFADEDDEDLFPSGMDQGIAAVAQQRVESEPDIDIGADKADSVQEPPSPHQPVAATGAPRRSRKPLFPSQLEESRDPVTPEKQQNRPHEGVSQRRSPADHQRQRGSATRRQNLEAPQWRAATGRGEDEANADRGAGTPRRIVPVSGPPVDPEYVRRIPTINLRPDRRVLVYYDPKHHVCEEYRLLGKNLLHTFANALPPSNKGRVVTLSSSVRGEGKTLTGINLSLTLAEDLAHRVLLIDGDLRHPKSHTYAGIPTTSGLNDMLASANPAAILEDCVQRTDTGLHVLMSSPAAGNPAPLLDSDRMTSILDILRERYALIIIDTPPVLLATDALSLGVKSDGMLFLLRARKTPREQIQEARQRIARLDIRLLGYIINNVRSFLPRIWSRYYYGNY